MRFRTLSIGVLTIGSVVLCAGLLAWATGVRVNTTKSIPVGIYQLSEAEISRGAYVLFCPPQAAIFQEAKNRGYIGSGFCPGGYGYMMKKVLGMSGDTVSVSGNGVEVNGLLVALSKPLEHDNLGQKLPSYEETSYRLAEGELLLMSDVSKISFDGRYYGPVNSSQVESVINPVLIKTEENSL